ncbi:hypothetical protein BV25DRAFT_1042514 [Artomyces pyxidatus]|uniref:Uncharacterized protein n=1 Tax=Artomyces pyxidatus TaxID=48021 RepID=A0ACB8SUX1_9AGAM|nr:hypothetical protein BV25DRAFT_1042514 [Artomyces pyxidatus]
MRRISASRSTCRPVSVGPGFDHQSQLGSLEPQASHYPTTPVPRPRSQAPHPGPARRTDTSLRTRTTHPRCKESTHQGRRLSSSWIGRSPAPPGDGETLGKSRVVSSSWTRSGNLHTLANSFPRACSFHLPLGTYASPNRPGSLTGLTGLFLRRTIWRSAGDRCAAVDPEGTQAHVERF